MSDVATLPECSCEERLLEEQETDRDDLVIRVCRECGRRHFEVAVEPFEIKTESP